LTDEIEIKTRDKKKGQKKKSKKSGGPKRGETKRAQKSDVLPEAAPEEVKSEAKK
jgi:hypothetical protein